MGSERLLLRLYMLDAALFLTHEIDSAYWQEWRLFGIPGGIGLFALIHIPAVLLLVWGLLQLAEARPWGYRIAALLAFVGFAALFIHAGYIATGHPEFRTPVSLAVIVAMAAVSVALGYLVLPRLGRRGSSSGEVADGRD